MVLLTSPGIISALSVIPFFFLQIYFGLCNFGGSITPLFIYIVNHAAPEEETTRRCSSITDLTVCSHASDESPPHSSVSSEPESQAAPLSPKFSFKLAFPASKTCYSFGFPLKLALFGPVYNKLDCEGDYACIHEAQREQSVRMLIG